MVVHSAPVAKAVNISTVNSLATNRISHREYIGEVSGSVDFTTNQYSINPGLPATFPWLWALASRYEHYRFASLSFEYRTQAPTTTTGAVMLAFDYNVDDSAPASKQEMLSYHGTVRAAPWTSATCSASHKGLTTRNDYLTRNGYVSDAKLYDIGNFFIATVGQADTSVIGELWVNYTIEFGTPASDGQYPAGWLFCDGTISSFQPDLGDWFPSLSSTSGPLPCSVVEANYTWATNTSSYGLEFSMSGSFLLSFEVLLEATDGSLAFPGDNQDNVLGFTGTGDFSNYEDGNPLYWQAYEVPNTETHNLIMVVAITVSVGCIVHIAPATISPYDSMTASLYVTPLPNSLGYPEHSVTSEAVTRALTLLTAA
jgi:hypothetical protein